MEMQVFGEGLKFPEGPIAMADGSVVLVEIRRATLSRVAPDGRIDVIAELGGGPNGAAIGPDGAVYVCNNGGSFAWTDTPDGLMLPSDKDTPYAGGSIQRVDLATGKFTTLYDGCDGRPLNGPNDLVFDDAGGFWFTDHGVSDGETRRLGGVYYAKADGSQITRWRHGQFSPNGIGLSPDGKVVYWADTWLQRLWGMDLAAPGEPAPTGAGYIPARVIANMPGLQFFDSLAVEASGKVCVGTLLNGGITVIDPSGSHEHVPFPDLMTTNICFGGADMRDAFVTCSSTGKLYKARWPRPGLRLPHNG
jgi:gluconolactonase